MCAKRIILIKRSFFPLIAEALVPVLFVAFGFWIMSLTFFIDSPAREIQTKLFPLPQRILVNQEPVIKHEYVNATTVDTAAAERLGEDFVTEFFQDNSVLPLIKNLPSSYTL